MDINKVHYFSEIFDEKIKIFKKVCDKILKSDTPHSNELFLLLLGISDSLESLSILSKVNKMRDCYAISRMIYETTINVLYISATDFKAMQDMIEYTTNKTKHHHARSVATDKEAVFTIFDGNKHTIGFAKNNPINMKGDQRDWTKDNINKRLNIIEKKYGLTILRFLQLAHLNIYRTSSDIIHGTLFGMKYTLGILNKKDSDFTVESMSEHSFNSIIILLLSISQCIYSIILAYNDELDLSEFEEKYNQLLQTFLAEGSEK